MNPEEIAVLKKHDKLMDEMRCPQDGRVQIKDRRCFGPSCYIQYRCLYCGFVESFESKSARAWRAMGHPMVIRGDNNGY